MRLRLTFVPLILVLVTANAFADEATVVAELVTAVGRQAIEKDKITGLSIGVARGETILCTKGFGFANLESNVPATSDTVFRIGSITKQFTAAAILLLVEDGKIRLDDPLTKFLPTYPQHAKKVTIRHLLQHTSGIKDFTRLPAYRKEMPLEVTQDEVIARFKDLPLDFRPGEQHRYCNSGYFLLAVVVEKASGKSFQQFVEGRLFNPHKLRRTICDDHARIVPHRASGYSNWGGIMKNARHINLKQTIGAGNLASTVENLLKWQQALVSNRLLTPESITLMTTPGTLNSGKKIDYGLGVLIKTFADQDAIRHGGGISGFRADLAYYPQSGYTIAILSNSEHANTRRISDRIAKRLFEKSLPKANKQ